MGRGICKVSTRCWHLSCETRVTVSILQPDKLGMKKFYSCGSSTAGASGTCLPPSLSLPTVPCARPPAL